MCQMPYNKSLHWPPDVSVTGLAVGRSLVALARPAPDTGASKLNVKQNLIDRANRTTALDP